MILKKMCFLLNMHKLFHGAVLFVCQLGEMLESLRLWRLQVGGFSHQESVCIKIIFLPMHYDCYGSYDWELKHQIFQLDEQLYVRAYVDSAFTSVGMYFCHLSWRCPHLGLYLCKLARLMLRWICKSSSRCQALCIISQAPPQCYIANTTIMKIASSYTLNTGIAIQT